MDRTGDLLSAKNNKWECLSRETSSPIEGQLLLADVTLIKLHTYLATVGRRRNLLMGFKDFANKRALMPTASSSYPTERSRSDVMNRSSTLNDLKWTLSPSSNDKNIILSNR